MSEYKVTVVTIPPMPTSQAEWECHWAFYKLTVAQRDAAWRECERWKAVAESLRNALTHARPWSPALVHYEVAEEESRGMMVE